MRWLTAQRGEQQRPEGDRASHLCCMVMGSGVQLWLCLLVQGNEITTQELERELYKVNVQALRLHSSAGALQQKTKKQKATDEK